MATVNQELPTAAQAIGSGAWTAPTDTALKTVVMACDGSLSSNTGCSNTAATSTENYGLSVWLYSDDAFDNWITARNAAASKQENEKVFIENQSSYTLKMDCNLSAIESNDLTSNKAGFGCCLQDLSQSGGGYCMTVNSSRDDVETYYLTEANFQTVLADPYDLSSIEAPTDKYTGITIFYVEDKTDDVEAGEIAAGRPFKTFEGYKVQPWPNSSWAEMYRFEKGDDAVGLIYNSDGTNAGKWIDEQRTLNSAMASFEALAATALTCVTYMMLA